MIIRDINDTLFNSILKYIKTNLYGIILSTTVIAAVSIAYVNYQSNDYITELKEEPIFQYDKKNYSYLGQGLTKEEVVDKYIEYLNNKDIDSANGLIAENFLTKEQLNKIPFDRINKKYYSNIKHDFIINNQKFFTNFANTNGFIINKDAYVGRFEDLNYLHPEEIHNSDLDIYAYYIELTYCIGSICDEVTKLMEVLETITIEGNTYILSEYAFLTDNYSRIVRTIFLNNDLSKIDYNYYISVFDKCLDEYGKVICDLSIVKFGEV